MKVLEWDNSSGDRRYIHISDFEGQTIVHCNLKSRWTEQQINALNRAAADREKRENNKIKWLWAVKFPPGLDACFDGLEI